MSEDTGGPAFPVKTAMFDCTQPGMTLRDYFAANAMQGLFAAGGGVIKTGDQWAQQAYTMADAMLKARQA